MNQPCLNLSQICLKRHVSVSVSFPPPLGGCGERMRQPAETPKPSPARLFAFDARFSPTCRAREPIQQLRRRWSCDQRVIRRRSRLSDLHVRGDGRTYGPPSPRRLGQSSNGLRYALAAELVEPASLRRSDEPLQPLLLSESGITAVSCRGGQMPAAYGLTSADGECVHLFAEQQQAWAASQVAHRATMSEAAGS